MWDLIVIGGGPGGCAAALRAAKGGLSVALFEPREVGGTCLNRGCVPTKALLHGAGPGCDWPALAEETARVVSTLRAGQEKQLQAARVQVVPARAVVTGPHTVEAGGETYEARNILIAAGSVPARPPIPGLDTSGVVTSDELLSDIRPRDRMVIIGGGVIGVELAAVWAAAGCQITIVEALDRLVANLDRELSQGLAMELKKSGVEVFTGASVSRIEPGPAVPASSPARRWCLPKRGRSTPSPPTRCWPPRAGGPPPRASLPMGPCRSWSGALSGWTGASAPPSPRFTPSGTPSAEPCFRVDGSFRTSIPSIYAIGDAIGGAMLAHKAEAEGRAVADLLLGRAPVRGTAPIPSCVYTSPELAQVGLTADQAKAGGVPVVSWPKWASPPTRPRPGACRWSPASACWGAMPAPSSRGASGAL